MSAVFGGEIQNTRGEKGVILILYINMARTNTRNLQRLETLTPETTVILGTDSSPNLFKGSLETLASSLAPLMPATSEYTETIVNISSAQILAMGTSPIELLPAPGVGKYYDIEKVVIEYNHVSLNYVWSGMDAIGLWFYDGVTYGDFCYLNLWSNNTDFIYKAVSGGSNWLPTEELYVNKPQPLNSSFELGTYNATDPTDGNGTMRVKIYHKTITFGA